MRTTPSAPANAQFERGDEPVPHPVLARWSGPILIVAAVLVVTHGFWLVPRLTNQQVDLLGFWFPRWCYLGHSVAAGHIPTWLPNQFGGIPFASDPQTGWLYAPVMGLFSTFSCARAFGLFITLNPIVAGLGLYLFGRNDGLSRPASSVAGLTLSLTMSGSAIVLSLPFAGMLAWIAVALAGAAGFIHARERVAMIGWFALTGFALSQVAAAHLTDGLLLGGIVLVLYTSARLIGQVRAGRRRPLHALALFAAPFLAFPVLSAAVLLPPLSLLPRSSLGHGYIALARLATELSGTRTPPAFLPGAEPWWGTSFARGPAGYVGAVAILSIPWALASRRWRAPAAAFAAVGFLGWLLDLDGLVKWKPLRRLAMKHFLGELWLHSPFRFRYLLVIALAVLAGYGLQAWLDRAPARSGRQLLVRILPIAGVVAVFVLWPAVVGGHVAQYAFFAIGAAYSVTILVLLARPGKRLPPLAALLPVLLAVELTTAGIIQQQGAVPGDVRDRLEKLPASGFGHSFPGYHTPFIDPARYLTPGPIASALMAAAGDHGRYLAFDPTIARNIRGFLTRQAPPDWAANENGRSILFGLEEVQGYSPVQVDRYWRLVRRVDHRQIYYNAAFFQSIDPQVLRLFGVEWLILPAGFPPPAVTEATPVAAEGSWRLYRIAHAQPRASVVFTIEAVPPGHGLDTVLDPSFDPATRAIVEPNPGFAIAGPPGPAPTGTAAYTEVSPEHVRVTVNADATGLLVVRNVFDRNWHASIDGRPVPVLPTDYLFQGVTVPSGRHVVDLTYRDPAIGLGLAVSATAWVLLFGVAGVLWYRRRRPAAQPAAATTA